MNLILMRTKVDHLNAWWEPHATSTPLKKIPAQLEIKNKAQKRVITQKNSVNVLEKLQNAQIAFGIHEQSVEKTKCVGSKRNRKSRLSTYFDPSSSSEDDTSEIKKRPIIKLGSEESNTKMFLRHEEPENEKIYTYNPTLSKNFKKNLKIKNSRKTLKNISETVNTMNQNNQVEIKKNETQNKTQSKTDEYFKDVRTNSDEENTVFSNYKGNRPFINENKSFLEKKENSINYTRGDENFRHPSDFNETERKKLKKTPKANHTISKSKPLKRKTSKNPQVLQIYQTVKTNNNKLLKFHKIKSEEVMDSNNSKNLTGNPTSKNMTTGSLKQMVNTASPLLILENKSNLSHQLFSESKEQECINILDLKSDEDDKVCTENKANEERPKRKMQTLEEHSIPKTKSSELPTTTVEEESEFGYILPKNDSLIQIGKLPVKAKKLKGKITKINCKKKSSVLRNQKDKNETKQKLINVIENEAIPDDPKSNKIKNQFVINGALNCSNSCPGMNISIQGNEINKKDTVKCVQEENAGDSSENSVFKQLDELSFNENGLGCSAAQCWNVNNVKCGVFKLKTKAQFGYQTLHSNSRLGGVLVKGHLRMKIGIKEKDMKEGDMAFIPPLTEWQATNIGECESVFYYWCGRFGSHSLLN